MEGKLIHSWLACDRAVRKPRSSLKSGEASASGPVQSKKSPRPSKDSSERPRSNRSGSSTSTDGAEASEQSDEMLKRLGSGPGGKSSALSADGIGLNFGHDGKPKYPSVSVNGNLAVRASAQPGDKKN